MNSDDPSSSHIPDLDGIKAGTFETALLAELRLGLPPLFYYRLQEVADDWTFVLKLHSLFEGALTQLLQEKLRLRSHIRESLTPRDSFTSRVHLASRMNLMEPDYRGFLLSLNRLRNDITHNIRFICFDIRSYVDSLSDSDCRRTAMTLSAGFKNLTLPDYRKITPPKARQRDCRTVREVFWHLNPKFSIWNSGLWALDLISLHFHFEETGGNIIPEADIAAKLQDLLHDPSVLEYRRTHKAIWPSDDAS